MHCRFCQVCQLADQTKQKSKNKIKTKKLQNDQFEVSFCTPLDTVNAHVLAV